MRPHRRDNDIELFLKRPHTITLETRTQAQTPDHMHAFSRDIMYKTHSRSNTPASRPRRRSQHAHARTRTHQMRRPAKLLQPQITVDYTAWINPFRLRHLFRNKPVEHHRKHARAHLHRTRARARVHALCAPK